MNSLLASSKIKEQLPKKSVGLLSTNSQPTNDQQLATKMVNCWSRVSKLLVYSLPTDDWQIFGELFFNFTNLPPFSFHTSRLPLDNLT